MREISGVPESVRLGEPRLVSGSHPDPLSLEEGKRQGALRRAVLEVERRWGVRASGRLFAGRYAPPLGLATGLPDLDAATGFGGIPRGKLSEITGPRSSGRLTLGMRVLAAAVADGGLAAYIDLPGELYPPVAAAMGIDLRRLVVVRPIDIHGATRAAATLLASEGFEAVLLDVAGENPRPNALARLAHLSGRGATACMFVTQRGEDSGRGRASRAGSSSGSTGLYFYSSLRLGVARRGWLWHEGPMGRAPVGMQLLVRVLKTRSAAGVGELVVDCPFIGRQVGAEDDLRSDTQVPHIAGGQGAYGVAIAAPGHLPATG